MPVYFTDSGAFFLSTFDVRVKYCGYINVSSFEGGKKITYMAFFPAFYFSPSFFQEPNCLSAD